MQSETQQEDVVKSWVYGVKLKSLKLNTHVLPNFEGQRRQGANFSSVAMGRQFSLEVDSAN